MCFIKFIGIDCPGCGLLHALWYLACGNLEASVAWHPMGIVLVVWGGLLLLQRVRWLQLSALTNRVVAHSVLIGMLVVWIVKLF